MYTLVYSKLNNNRCNIQSPNYYQNNNNSTNDNSINNNNGDINNNGAGDGQNGE